MYVEIANCIFGGDYVFSIELGPHTVEPPKKSARQADKQLINVGFTLGKRCTGEQKPRNADAHSLVPAQKMACVVRVAFGFQTVTGGLSKTRRRFFAALNPRCAAASRSTFSDQIQ